MTGLFAAIIALSGLKAKLGSRQRWGKSGSGILFVCPEDKTLLLFLRSWDVFEPGTWGVVGGRIDDPSRETAWDSAVKESIEETGSLPEGEVVGQIKYKETNFEYTTFIYAVSKETKDNWEIQLNWENDDYEWIHILDLESPSIPLHFGVEYILNHHLRDLVNTLL